MTSELRSVISEMEAAADRLLASLSPEQRENLVLPLEPEKLRNWSYTPIRHAGLLLSELNAEQRQNVRRLLASSLSEAGYNRGATIMGLENVLDRLDNFPQRNLAWSLNGPDVVEDTRRRDSLNYSVAIFNSPGADAGWGWRISGHHVSVHFTVKDGKVSPTPVFFGVSPAYIKMPGNTLFRPLAPEEDVAKDLLSLLRDNQLKRAVIAPMPPLDMVQSSRPRVEEGAVPWPETFGAEVTKGIREGMGITDEIDDMLRYSRQPKGLSFSEMDSGQQAAFQRLLSVYFDRVNEAIAGQFAALLSPANLNTMAFAWAGSVDPQVPQRSEDPHNLFYYRVQGDGLLIEFDNAQADGNHMHSVWRDPAGDFGGDILASHYAASHT